MLYLGPSAFDDFAFLLKKYVPWEDGSAEWEEIRGASAAPKQDLNI